jgi:hypothetical protein
MMAVSQGLLNVIFSKLDFTDVISVGMIFKQLGQALSAATGTARHWIVTYSMKFPFPSVTYSEKFLQESFKGLPSTGSLLGYEQLSCC